jgi:hypothetical protein
MGAVDLFRCPLLLPSIVMPKRKESDLGHERLLGLLHYDLDTGVWTWLKDAYRSRVKAGDIAGTIGGTPDGQSYRYLGVDNFHHKAARLAWFYVNGEWPAGKVTHADADSLNDKYSNLRVATRSEITAAGRMRIDNTSGFRGVSWNNRVRKFQSYITQNYKRRHLGWFDCPAEAHKVRVAAAEHLFGEFARA